MDLAFNEVRYATPRNQFPIIERGAIEFGLLAKTKNVAWKQSSAS
jgi:hypothetical protein